MDVHELSAAYALDALDPDERTRYESHLASCEECRNELATLSETAGLLAWGVESPAPPPELRERILTAAASERGNVVPLRLRDRPGFRAIAAVAAVAACAAIGFGAWATTLSHSLDRQRSALAAEQRAVQIYLDPSSTKIALKGHTGAVAVDSTGQAVLVVRHLDPAPAGKVYEAWVIPPASKPIRAGVFDGGGSMTMVRLEQAVPSGSVVATTMERDGGVDAPTSEPLFTART
jgi:anti-sigma-K factor RskA